MIVASQPRKPISYRKLPSQKVAVPSANVNRRGVSRGAHIFSLYSCNLAIVLRENLFGVKSSLRALSQMANVRPDEPLFLYSVDQRRLYHAGWQAQGRPFIHDMPVGWEGGLFPYRLRVSQSMPVVMSMPVHAVESEIHERDYRLGFDRASFKAAANYWIHHGQVQALLQHPGWKPDRRATQWNQEASRFPDLQGEPLRPLPAIRKRLLGEQRLTLLLQKFQPQLSTFFGLPLGIVDTFHYQSSSNVLRGLIAESHPVLTASSILEAQGEIDILALAGQQQEELWVFELKCGTLGPAVLRQLTRYLWPLLHHPMTKGIRRLRPVFIGSHVSRRFNVKELQHPRITEPLVLTFDKDVLSSPQWWDTSFEELQLKQH